MIFIEFNSKVFNDYKNQNQILIASYGFNNLALMF